MRERIRKQIIQSLLSGERSIYELIDFQDASLSEFFYIIQDLQKEGVIDLKDGFVRLVKVPEFVRLNEGSKIGPLQCKGCEGTGYIPDSFFKGILATYSKITKERPQAIEVYDQGFISEIGVMRRVEFIYERGDLLGAKILIVGDDDLLSIAAGLTSLPQEIVVIEIDQRLIEFIEGKAKQFNLPIKVFPYDVQKPLPPELKAKFDVFVTDPVETIPGLKLFLSRGVSALKGKGSAGYFGLTTLEASRDKWYQVQRMIYEMGFIITDIRRKFSTYPGNEKNFFRYQEKLPIVQKLGVKIDYDWYKSSFFRIEAVRDPLPLVEGEAVIDEALYKDQESWATPY